MQRSRKTKKIFNSEKNLVTHYALTMVYISWQEISNCMIIYEISL